MWCMTERMVVSPYQEVEVLKINLARPMLIKALEREIAISSRGLDKEINPGIKQLKEKDVLEYRNAIASIEEVPDAPKK